MSSPVPAASLGSTPQLSVTPVLGTSSSSSPCDDLHNMTPAMHQYLLQQQQHHNSSPEQSSAMTTTPEKLDVKVDLSSFYGLPERITTIQDSKLGVFNGESIFYFN